VARTRCPVRWLPKVEASRRKGLSRARQATEVNFAGACKASGGHSLPSVRRSPSPLHPTPHNSHPTTYPLPPASCPLLRAPYTKHPIPFNLHPTPYTLHCTPYTLHPTPYIHPPGICYPKSHTPDLPCLTRNSTPYAGPNGARDCSLGSQMLLPRRQQQYKVTSRDNVAMLSLEITS